MADRPGRAAGGSAVLHHRLAPPARRWSGATARSEFRRLADRGDPGVRLNIIQRQLGQANLGTTSIYLHDIDPEEIILAVRARRAPMISTSAGLRL